MIYVPEDEEYSACYVVESEGVIRAYNTVPSNNTSYSYRDYYIHSNYIYKDGEGRWLEETTLPTCLSTSIITHDVMHRLDYDKILNIFFIMFIFIILIPLYIITRFFKKR